MTVSGAYPRKCSSIAGAFRTLRREAVRLPVLILPGLPNLARQFLPQLEPGVASIGFLALGQVFLECSLFFHGHTNHFPSPQFFPHPTSTFSGTFSFIACVISSRIIFASSSTASIGV